LRTQEMYATYSNAVHKLLGTGSKTKRIWIDYIIKFIIRALAFQMIPPERYSCPPASRRYSPGWALASSTTSLHRALQLQL
jgi:hypothetical protein